MQLSIDAKLKKEISIPRDYRVVARGTAVGYFPVASPLTDTKYALQARYPGATNEQTASELADIVNFVSWLDQSPGTVFLGAILYEENGHYVFRK